MRAMTTVHPFPARMAAEIALRRLARLPADSLVLDPMAGSGTVLREAAERGHRAIGFDVDPLAVLMSKVLTTPVDTDRLLQRSKDLVARARRSRSADALWWIDEDGETRDFVDYWFGKSQQEDLRKLSGMLEETRGPIADALRIGLSRIIVTKRPGAGASLGRDISHSRPRRVSDRSDFSVLEGFTRSVERLAKRLETVPPGAEVAVRLGDARLLSQVASRSVGAIITSPPYLNAIDYLRGHRLALVWLGYGLGRIRSIRARSIGAERAPTAHATNDSLIGEITEGQVGLDRLPPRVRGILDRYALDLASTLTEAYRVLEPGGTASLVVGDSTLRGVFVRNTLMVKAAARRAGFRFRHQAQRDLPAGRRYMPPPSPSGATAMNKRMRVEAVITVTRPSDA